MNNIKGIKLIFSDSNKSNAKGFYDSGITQILFFFFLTIQCVKFSLEYSASCKKLDIGRYQIERYHLPSSTVYKSIGDIG